MADWHLSGYSVLNRERPDTRVRLRTDTGGFCFSAATAGSMNVRVRSHASRRRKGLTAPQARQKQALRLPPACTNHSVHHTTPHEEKLARVSLAAVSPAALKACINSPRSCCCLHSRSRWPCRWKPIRNRRRSRSPPSPLPKHYSSHCRLR